MNISDLRLPISIALVVALSFSLLARQALSQLNITGEAAVLMDLETGKVLWAKEEKKRLQPGGTVKILTGLVALQRSRPDELVTVSDTATSVGGFSAHLQAGEQIRMKDLLYALVVPSGNDAAVAIADHVGGSVEGLVELMNVTAQRLGAENSSFINPTGLDQEGQYTTAADLALIARAALENATFHEIVATRSRHWKSKAWEGLLINDNKLLSSYGGATGVQTGYTSEAGHCLVAAAQSGSEAYVAVVLNST
ncbi:MAG: D-alanyl-D-alanine carboxypeptidase family protein [Candidatus Binatia bacterium]